MYTSVIVTMCPSLSNSSVESSLKKLAKDGYIEKKGASRATYYVKKDEISSFSNYVMLIRVSAAKKKNVIKITDENIKILS